MLDIFLKRNLYLSLIFPGGGGGMLTWARFFRGGFNAASSLGGKHHNIPVCRKFFATTRGLMVWTNLNQALLRRFFNQSTLYFDQTFGPFIWINLSPLYPKCFEMIEIEQTQSKIINLKLWKVAERRESYGLRVRKFHVRFQLKLRRNQI